MHCPRYKTFLVLLALFNFGSSTPPRNWSTPSRSAPSLPDFPEDYVILNGFHDMDSTTAPSTTPPSTTNDMDSTPSSTTPPLTTNDMDSAPSSTTPQSTPEPFSTTNPYQFYMEQFKKKSDSNKEKKLRLYNINTPVERLRIKLHKLVDILINWIKNLD